MHLLGIETSTMQASVAIGTEDGVVAEATLAVPRRHAEFLVPAIEFCLHEAGLEPGHLAGVAVGLGPGLFTGMRVGIATARGLARSLRVPVCGFTSLDTLAFGARLTRRTIVPVIDARRGEVYYAIYQPVPGGVQRMSEQRVAAPDAVAAELTASDHDVLLVGDGGHIYRDLFDERGVAEYGDAIHRYPKASTVIELAIPVFQREEFGSPETLVPVYLRRPDAEINWAVVA